MGDITFKVTGASESAARMRVQARQFSFVIDEPPELGGSDAGPNPVEYVLAALAGCLNVTAHLVAREHKIRVEALTIDIEGNLNPARLLKQPTDDRAGYKAIFVTIHAKTDAEDTALAKWADEIERRCPVSDNLGASTPVQVSIRPAT